MKVKKLIEKLEKYDPNLDVVICPEIDTSIHGEYHTVLERIVKVKKVKVADSNFDDCYGEIYEAGKTGQANTKAVVLFIEE